jgi:endonuclease-3
VTAPSPRTPANLDAHLARLRALYPEPHCELAHRSAWELLVATQLSAQCTDRQVNLVTPELFRRWPDAAALAQADPSELEAIIRSTGFYRNKARNLLGAARILVERHGGEVPASMEALVALPGTARKTANVVLGTAFGIEEGVVVDTHVLRVTRRWGWHEEKDPVKVERVLMALLPRGEWDAFGHRCVLFGRYHCGARAPDCAGCGLAESCPSALVVEPS